MDPIIPIGGKPMLFREQLRSLPKSLRRKFRNLGLGQMRSLRALANIGEVAIAPILSNATDQFGLGIERYGVRPDQQDFNLFSETAGANFFADRGDRDFAFLQEFDPCCDRIVVDPDSQYQLVQGSGFRPGALLYEVSDGGRDLIAMIAGNTRGLAQFGGLFYLPDPLT